MTRANRPLTAYAAVSVGYLGCALAGLTTAQDIAKPLLMPLLALAVGLRALPPGTSRLLLGALLASCAGDTLLIFGGAWFLVGMGGFAVAHVCYISLLVCGGALRDRARLLRTATGYGLLWIILISSLWPDLTPALRLPLAGYSLLLAGTAVTSAGLSRRTGLGGALFLLSDSLIATGLAHWPQPPVPDFWVMATYLAGQYLLASGTTRHVLCNQRVAHTLVDVQPSGSTSPRGGSSWTVRS
ncbi:lysoplasmalogenase [Streptacidiphilus sp. P02-A3a]|uniref:lysoplasmalogenase n=1 Tax=Streptacidiphilus sp. P02-A3a TaxID=2704468 RepID=UPI0015F7E383|nr:lysoplasmalogenase [Streptacidiphilus sp. P02-A3a]QMU68925.1 lysoplasmalogenase [Streptacidiphilus sp. P02-A3a]